MCKRDQEKGSTCSLTFWLVLKGPGDRRVIEHYGITRLIGSQEEESYTCKAVAKETVAELRFKVNDEYTYYLFIIHGSLGLHT